jgi:putative autotransporter adhesin-like protein
MKKTAISILLAATLFGCQYAGKIHHGVAGSGVRKAEKRTLSPFTSITTEGAFEIEIVCQKPQSFEIEGDDNLLPLVSSEVANGILRIKNLRGYSTDETIKIRISVPNIDGLTAQGAGTIEITGLNNNKFEIDADGAPTIRVTGETKTLDIEANGAGKIDTHKLRAAKAIVKSNGVSNVELFASQELDVTVSGPSRVTYEGDPKVNKTVNGPGSVEKRESSGA